MSLKCLYISYSSHTSLPDIAELVVHVPHVVFDVDRDAGRLQHLHVELLREGTDEQGPDRVDAGDLVGHAELLGLVSVLKVQHTCRQEGDRRGTGSLARSVAKRDVLFDAIWFQVL